MGLWNKRQPSRPVVPNVWRLKNPGANVDTLDPTHNLHSAYVERYANTLQPDPGAMAYARETYGLPDFTPIGAGIANRHIVNVIQPPVLTAVHAVLLTGIGGPIAGQMILQPLVNPQDDVFGG